MAAVLPKRRARGALSAWMAAQAASVCACGCGREMPIKKSHAYHGAPRYLRGHHNLRDGLTQAEWLKHQEAPLCACGCGERILLQPWHRKNGIPAFRHGHESRVRERAKALDAWVRENRGKHICGCGCGRRIAIRRCHFRTGIPECLAGHHSNRLSGTLNPRYKHDRSLLKSRGSAFTEATKRLIYEAFAGCCAWCGAYDLTEFDHVVPVALGGSNEPSNGQLLCPTCHRWKTAVTIIPRRPKRQPEPIETENL